MGRLLLITLLVLGNFCVHCLADDSSEKAEIQKAKVILVSSLDTALPKITLEFFLNYEAEGEPVHWEVKDCGELSGNPTAERGRKFPICVEAAFDFKNDVVRLTIAMRDVDKGKNPKPTLLSLTVTDISGEIHSLRRLSQLPMQLRRPWRHEPRDLPLSVGSL